MKQKWTKEQIWDWYDSLPWITGFNFYPSTTINQVEFWQSYDHNRVFTDIGKELSLAQSLGFNSLRTLFPFELWRMDSTLFFTHIDEFLSLCDAFGISVMPVLFDDCCMPKEKQKPIQLGKQPDPVPGYFGGSPVSPFEDTTSIGYNPTDAPGMDAVVRDYIHELAEHYRNDPRILIWNIWNEPGNSGRGSTSLPMMENVFSWLREEDVSQPLTADVFAAMPGKPFPDAYLKNPKIESEIELKAIELSDIISFHYYGDYVHTRNYISDLRAYGRPIICDEWLHRPMRSFIQTHLPLFKREKIGSYFFGFVNGKNQFHEPWEYLKAREDMDFSLWMHDIFHSNFVPYDDEEIQVIRKCNLS
ncbi:MAG: cellulase family glycosylhydrolase [Clostridiales bacterium]|nr:cellulase family glycosylhydrolase [Clostridiales bacterium]